MKRAAMILVLGERSLVNVVPDAGGGEDDARALDPASSFRVHLR